MDVRIYITFRKELQTANHKNTKYFKHKMQANELMVHLYHSLVWMIIRLCCISPVSCMPKTKAIFGAMGDKSKFEMPSMFVLTFNVTWKLENTRALIRTICTHKMRVWTINFVAASFVLMRYSKLHFHFAHYRVRPYDSKKYTPLRECIETNAISSCERNERKYKRKRCEYMQTY